MKPKSPSKKTGGAYGYAPAVGTKGARKPLPATLHPPEFLRLDRAELQYLLNRERDPLTIHLYLLIVSQADFTSGELLTNYPRLIELCTPPAGERGGRMVAAPTLKQVRTRLDRLESIRMIQRNLASNEAQGMLRIFVYPRGKKKTAPTRK